MSIKNTLQSNALVMGLYDKLLPYYCRLRPESAVKMVYRQTFGREINLDDPHDLNEKINCLKLLYKDDPLVIRCADKYAVRDYLTEQGFGDYLNELYGAYDRPEDIDWNALPERFVLKFNKGAGMNLFCTDKASFDTSSAVKQMKRWYKDKTYYKTCELHYGKAKPKIICEKFLGDGKNTLPEDYKLYCINGKPVFMLICLDRGNTLKRVFFDRDYRLLDVNDDYKALTTLPEKPRYFDKMFELAEQLSAPFPIVRVDFFEVGGRLYIGELTFTPQGGYLRYNQKWLDKLGEELTIPARNKEK